MRRMGVADIFQMCFGDSVFNGEGVLNAGVQTEG